MSSLVFLLAFCCWLLSSASGCKGASKQEIPLAREQTYELQSSGKLKVHATAVPGAERLERLLVKRKNEPAGAGERGCWQCSDCICNGGECSCTECTAVECRS